MRLQETLLPQIGELQLTYFTGLIPVSGKHHAMQLTALLSRQDKLATPLADRSAHALPAVLQNQAGNTCG